MWLVVYFFVVPPCSCCFKTSHEHENLLDSSSDTLEPSHDDHARGSELSHTETMVTTSVSVDPSRPYVDASDSRSKKEGRKSPLSQSLRNMSDFFAGQSDINRHPMDASAYNSIHSSPRLKGSPRTPGYRAMPVDPGWGDNEAEHDDERNLMFQEDPLEI